MISEFTHFDSSTIDANADIMHQYQNCCRFKCLESSELSLSEISKSFSSDELSKVVKSLVMSRYGDDFTKYLEKSLQRHSKKCLELTNSSGFSEDCDGSGYVSSDKEQNEYDDVYFAGENTICSKIVQSTPKKSFSTQVNSMDPTSCSISALSELISVETYAHHPTYEQTKQFNDFLQQHGSIETIEKVLKYTNNNNNNINDAIYQNPHLVELNKKLQILDAHIQQISKLMTLGKYKNNCAARIEAEKMLIVKTLTKNFLLDKIKSNVEQNEWNIGKLTLTNLNFRIRPVNLDDLCFFCVLFTKNEIIASEIVRPQSDGLVLFTDAFVLDDLPVEFHIQVQVYYGIRQKLHKSPKKLQTGDENKFFHLWGETYFNVEDINLSQSTLRRKEEILKVNIEGHAEIKQTMLATGFLQIGRRTRTRMIYWNRYWVVLNGSKMDLFINPIDVVIGKCVKSIDFVDYSLKASARIASRAECPRDKTITINLLENNEAEEYFFSFESNSEFTFWKNAIFQVVKIAEMWKNLIQVS